MKTSGSNNSQMGGASPHNAYVAKAIVRSSGDACANMALNSKTRSPHRGTSKHYQYESAGEGWGGNVKR